MVCILQKTKWKQITEYHHCTFPRSWSV